MSTDLLVTALKAQVADLQLARKQANEVVVTLMQRNLSEAQQHALFELVVTHMKAQDLSRSDQLVGVLRTALLGLNQMAQNTTDAFTRQHLIDMIKNFNIVLEDK